MKFIFYLLMNFSAVEEEKPVLPLLSESLVLDSLWETLSACLLELEHTPDHHAVLVLQVKNQIRYFQTNIFTIFMNLTYLIYFSARSRGLFLSTFFVQYISGSKQRKHNRESRP